MSGSAGAVALSPDASAQRERLLAEMFALEDAADGGPMDHLRASLHAELERAYDALAACS